MSDEGVALFEKMVVVRPAICNSTAEFTLT